MEKPCKSATMGILIPQTDICSRYNDWRVEDRQTELKYLKSRWGRWHMALQWFLLSWLVRHTYIVQFSYRGGFFDDCWWMDGRWLKGGGDGEEEIPKSRVCLFCTCAHRKLRQYLIPTRCSVHSQTLLCGSGRPKQVMDNIAVVALNFCRPRSGWMRWRGRYWNIKQKMEFNSTRSRRSRV